LNLYLPNITFTEQTLTKHPPKILSTPEEDIPKIKEKKTSSWTYLIGIVLIAGIAAAGGGGGGSEGGNNTGNVTVGW
jgi:hypothetical protein